MANVITHCQAQVVSPFHLGKSLSYHYKVSTKQFTRISCYDPTNPDTLNRCKYRVDLAVEQHPEYRDIPSSTWCVTIWIAKGGHVRFCVKPKEEPEGLKQASIVLVDWDVRLGWADGGDPFFGAFMGHLGPDGWKWVNSGSLVELRDAFEVHRHYARKEEVDYVSVSLTFIVEKSAARRDLETLLDSGMLSDCQLVCGTRQFPVHRAILAAQSPVFAAMFQTDMKEKASGIVKIDDISPGALEMLLKYGYTRGLANADVDLTELWTAADKYDFVDMKQECERLMLGSITDENALKYLIFGVDRGLGKLKVAAAKTISQQSP